MNQIKTPSNQIQPQSLPIPHPSHPKQYRAIGVIRGKYQPSANALTKGMITTLSQNAIDSVLLGKTISVVKNHVDLTQNQYWIVYPHTIFTENISIHAQIVGVWQPNSLNDNLQLAVTEDYFSIRGEVVYSSRKDEKIIVKIYSNNSSNNQNTEQNSFFKIQLTGKIPDQSVKHFYNFDIVLENRQLVVKRYLDLGLIAVRYSNIKSVRRNTNYTNYGIPI